MIVWGHSTKFVPGATLPQSCRVCNTKHLKIYKIIKVFQLYWMAFFPYETTHSVSCSHCGANYPSKYFASSEQEDEIKTPLSCFVEPIVIILFIGLILIAQLFEK